MNHFLKDCARCNDYIEFQVPDPPYISVILLLEIVRAFNNKPAEGKEISPQLSRRAELLTCN